MQCGTTMTYMQLQRGRPHKFSGGSGQSGSFGRCLLGPRRARHPEEADTGMLPNSPLPKLTTAAWWWTMDEAHAAASARAPGAPPASGAEKAAAT